MLDRDHAFFAHELVQVLGMSWAGTVGALIKSAQVNLIADDGSHDEDSSHRR